MIHFDTTILAGLALATLCSSSAIAQDPSSATDLAAQAKIEHFVDETLQMALDAAWVGQPVAPILSELKTAVGAESVRFVGFEGECLIQKHLAAQIEELRKRAALYMLRVEEVEELQRDVVMARLERSMNELKKLWSEGKIADEVYEKAVLTIQDRALDWLDQHVGNTVRQRLTESIAIARKHAGSAIDVLHEQQAFLMALYEARLLSAYEMLQKNIEAGVVTKRDYMLVEELTKILKKMKKALSPYEC
jgi:hypothetical protein